MDTLKLTAGTIIQTSVVNANQTICFLARLHNDGDLRLGIRGDISGFTEITTDADIALCPLTPHNADVLRSRLPWLKPVPLGFKTSFGFGDRMGLATPGHIQALRATDPSGKIAPIFAQQSVRENTRTSRTPQQVMDDAMWSVFREGWRDPWGADADHVKELADLDAFINAGYTFFTIDPSDHVDNAANSDSLDTLRSKTNALPWDILKTSYDDLFKHYCARPIVLDGLTLSFDETILRRALVKYGRAVAHTIMIAANLSSRMAGRPYDLELSVDETDTPTTAEEHFFIAGELARCSVPVVSLAPRFAGKFQKGVDYIGSISKFEDDFARHAAIMRHFGSYKLSIHTGSDKFSIYPVIARHTQGRVHVKTAGTSYLEALRVAALNPNLFRQMLDLARARFEKDRKTYFLDAQLNKVPVSSKLADEELSGLLEQFDARQVLHVTFGSILDACGPELRGLITDREKEYVAALVAHFGRHIAPFV
jgi:hypothetical protein